MKQQETDTMEEEKMKKRAKKIVALFLTAGILLSGTAACSNVEGMHLSGSTRELNVTKEDTGKSGDNVQMLPSDEKSDKIFADSYADFAIKAFQNSYEARKKYNDITIFRDKCACHDCKRSIRRDFGTDGECTLRYGRLLA